MIIDELVHFNFLNSRFMEKVSIDKDHRSTRNFEIESAFFKEIFSFSDDSYGISFNEVTSQTNPDGVKSFDTITRNLSFSKMELHNLFLQYLTENKGV